MIARIFAIAAVTALPALMMPGLSFADPSFRADDVTKHFMTENDCGGEVCLSKGATRRVCIGTDTACAEEEKKAVAAKDPGAFDMLITFDLGSDRLSAQARENLAEFAKALNGEALKNATFNIDGHTDARGSDSFNQGLSERRAESVVRYLESLGISRDRLVAKGHGESDPRTADPFDDVNRRVEATLRIQ